MQVKEELERILSQVSGGGKADSVSRLLQAGGRGKGLAFPKEVKICQICEE